MHLFDTAGAHLVIIGERALIGLLPILLTRLIGNVAPVRMTHCVPPVKDKKTRRQKDKVTR
jgi:hypothetical protein